MSPDGQHMHADASFSRVYLNRSNNPFKSIHELTNDPEILAERQRRNEQFKRTGTIGASRKSFPPLLKTVALAKATQQTEQPQQSQITAPSATMLTPDNIEEEIYAPPQSSDEEETENTLKKPDILLPTPASTQQSPQLKRPLGSADTNRRTSKRLKVDKEEPAQSSMLDSRSTAVPSQPVPDWLAHYSQSSQPSQSSQKKATNKYTSQRKKLQVSNDYEPVSSPKQKQRELNLPTSSPGTPASRTSKRSHKLALPSNATESPSPPRPVLYIPEDDEDDDAVLDKDTTIGVSKSNISKPTEARERRRGSTSSLSSVDSIASIQLDRTTKAQLNADTSVIGFDVDRDLLPTQVRCPMCKRPTLRVSLDIPSADMSRLPVRRQQRFCLDHRMRDAQLTWKEREYPELDFDTLASSDRLHKHVEALIPIIKRKKPSFYLKQLDDAIKDAKGNQTKINNFFNITTMSLVHHGYYGPRGAKIINRAIAEDADIAKVLKRQTRSDKAFQVANLGRLVDSVLLPEVLTTLVQEDMVLLSGKEGQEEARKILEDSVEIGLLLCPDDDQVDDGLDHEHSYAADEDDEFNDNM